MSSFLPCRFSAPLPLPPAPPSEVGCCDEDFRSAACQPHGLWDPGMEAGSNLPIMLPNSHPLPRIRACRHFFFLETLEITQPTRFFFPNHSCHFMDEEIEAQKNKATFLKLPIQLATKLGQKTRSLDS